MISHQAFLQRAIGLAVRNVEEGGGPYGALIVRNGEIIAQSGNRVTTDLDPTAHAEIMAIRMACRKLQDFQLGDCILYSNCEPCPMCLGAVYWARLHRVYFACDRDDAAAAGFDDRYIYDELTVAPASRQIAMLQLDLPERLRPFGAWAEKADKVPY